jgi:bifunctional non-homologous end joining protein LigD
MAAPKVLVRIDGREVAFSNLDKVLWPEDGYTKADLIDHYVRVAPYLLPHLKERPLVLTRYPDGIDGEWFYNKDAPPGKPAWIRTWSDQGSEKVIRYILADGPAVLAYVANLGAIELHPWLSRSGSPEEPDWAVIDLDPAEGAGFADALLLARLCRQILDAVGIRGFPKLSGATGIHVYCPCGPGHTYGETADFCHQIGRLLLRVYPQKVTLERAVARRTGKVYVDFLQNRRGQTITSVYGLRPRPGAPVSAPVTWDEIEAEPPFFTIGTIGERLRRVGDLFAPMLGMSQDLRRAAATLGLRGRCGPGAPVLTLCRVCGPMLIQPERRLSARAAVCLAVPAS